MSWRIIAPGRRPKPSDCGAAVDLLAEQVGAQPRLADSGRRARSAPAAGPGEVSGRSPVGERRPNRFQVRPAASQRPLLRAPGVDDPGRGDQDQAARSAPAPRSPPRRRRSRPSSCRPASAPARSRASRRSPGAARRRPASRSPTPASGSPRSRAGRAPPPGGAAEVRQVLQPVLPAAGEPVDEQQRLALADLDVVDLAARQLDPPQVLAASRSASTRSGSGLP